ncbi:hypothetical protein [Endozoicomonas sp. YOMI1]|uniref:hypothetical protein n=1 Tax=Endozoicomonas sp. YOMI1 TaxID=2828739 RepID=UPI0021478C1C|nr:hypothetical protein [Endozoicomonas sp. YOMI1]
MFDLALRLHKSVQEIRQLPCSELTGWIAYFSLQDEPEPVSKHDEYIQLRKVLG